MIYCVNGSSYEPQTDYLLGWVPGTLGLPCPDASSPEILRGFTCGSRDRDIQWLREVEISTVLWHECRHNNCKEIK